MTTSAFASLQIAFHVALYGILIAMTAFFAWPIIRTKTRRTRRTFVSLAVFLVLFWGMGIGLSQALVCVSSWVVASLSE